MRWERLFDDLEAQLDAGDAADHAAEVADRTRRELGLVVLPDRLVAAVGRTVALHLLAPAGGAGHQGSLEGRLVVAAEQWLVLATGTMPAPVLVPLTALGSVVGLDRLAPAEGPPTVARRLSLASALRGLARDRSPVRVDLLDGTCWHGTIDAVGADHVDLAEHPHDEPRRRSAVRSVRTVPLRSLASVRPAVGTSGLGD